MDPEATARRLKEYPTCPLCGERQWDDAGMKAHYENKHPDQMAMHDRIAKEGHWYTR